MPVLGVYLREGQERSLKELPMRETFGYHGNWLRQP